ncbi:MAG: glutamine amidotransferase [Kiritimatiellae bacterium]|nr:glutamine amidotransferase [Kiritimatiellia bacterium]
MKKMLFSGLFLLFFLPSYVRAEAVLQEAKGPDGKTCLIMENEFLRCMIAPQAGGRISSFIYKPAGNTEWIAGPAQPGLFLDHLWQQSWPGSLLSAAYEYEIISRGPERAQVRMWKVVDSGDGVDTVWGVRYEKTLTLEQNSPLILCKVKLNNTADKPRSPGIWIQHILSVNNAKENIYFRPSTRGIEKASIRLVGADLVPEMKGLEFVKTPVAGWSAAVDPKSKLGMVFLVDYNYLRWWYNCISAWTMEVFFDQVKFSPGKSWETEMALYPIEGFDGVVHGSKAVTADLKGSISGDGLLLSSSIAAVTKLNDGKLTLTAETPVSHTPAGSKEVELGVLSRQPIQKTVELKLKEATLKEGVVVKALLTAAGGVEEKYEIFVPPAVSGKGLETIKVDYVRAKPAKHKQFFKPEALRLVPHEGFKVFEARGLWFREWQAEQAVRLSGGRLDLGYYENSRVYGERMSCFPSDYETLMQYDVIILNNVPVSAFNEEEMEFINDFVEAGGALLILGGRFAFAGGGYKDSPLEGLLPVIISKSWDVKKATEPMFLMPGKDSPITAGIDWKKAPVVPFFHKVERLKPEVQVLILAGKEPFLISHRHGKGKIAVIMATVEGKGTAEVPAFFEWQQWPELLSRLLKLMQKQGG